MTKYGISRIIIAGVTLALCQSAGAEGLLAAVNPAVRALPSANRDMTFSGQYFEANDYTSMRYFSDDWRGFYTPRDGKNLAISFARADASVRQESWSVGYFYRQDILLESNKDMTDIVHANKIGTPVPVGQIYDTGLDMNGFTAQGIRLDKAFFWKGTSDLDVIFGVGASLLKGQRTRMGNAQGQALSTLTGYTYNASLTDADSKKTYPFMPPGEVSGLGYALDLGWRMQWQDGKRLDLAINDLIGEIRWKNLPLTTMNANSATVTYDAQGYIAFNPTLSGQNSRVDLTQKFNTKGSILFHTPLADAISADLSTEWIKDNLFPRLGMQYATDQGMVLAADYDVRFSTIGVGVYLDNVFLSVRTQSLDLDQSRGYGIEAGFTFQF
jgi:hypothetical protein